MEWISVKEKLPGTGVRVLACSKRGSVFICKRDSPRNSFFRIDGTSKYRCFTHWMPLPEPPKEQENEEI